MALRTQKAVIANLDRTSGGHMRRAAKRYRAETIGPLVEVVKTAGNGQEALRRLGPGLLARMNGEALEMAIVDADVQSAMIGRVSALPPKRGEVRSRKSEVQSAKQAFDLRTSDFELRNGEAMK